MYGSSVNMILDTVELPKPEIGMGVTQVLYSDRNAYTIILIGSPTRLVIQRDKATRVGEKGMSDVQSYEYERDPNGETKTITLRSDKRWRERGEKKNNGVTFVLGVRNEFYDFSR
jgi:hypothetical protein